MKAHINNSEAEFLGLINTDRILCPFCGGWIVSSESETDHKALVDLLDSLGETSVCDGTMRWQTINL